MRRNILGRLRTNIILRTTVYYIVLFGVAAALAELPQAQKLIHANLDALLSGGGGFPGLGSTSPKKGVFPVSIDSSTLALTMAAAMIGSVLLSIPVACIYPLPRQKKDYHQSVAQTRILPPALLAAA